MVQIPETAGCAPHHFSTWWIQEDTLTKEAQAQGAYAIRDNLTHEALFGQRGWCHTLYPKVRKDLIFTICDGWELPDSQHGRAPLNVGLFGSQVLDAGKFPGYGDTPAERLKFYADNVKAAGWKGAGLWICAQEDAAHQRADGSFDPAYWIERLSWSRDAGIAYWEVDWGRHCGNPAFRRFLSLMARELAPELVIEHIVGCGGLNDEFGAGRVSPAYLHACVQYARFSDVFRSYDITHQLSLATTLDRVAELLLHALTPEEGACGYVCCEDEVYLAGALGLTTMVMRHAAHYTALDEVARVLRWQRLAPAFPLKAGDAQISAELLADEWTFRGDTWFTVVDGKTVKQYAPAVTARGGLALPKVETDGTAPFVAASRYPCGAVALGVFGRTLEGHVGDVSACRAAKITLELAAPPRAFALFGEVGSLCLKFPMNPSRLRVYAADLLAEGPPIDISGSVFLDGETLTLDGALLARIGLSAASMGDTSRPGVLLSIEQEKGETL